MKPGTVPVLVPDGFSWGAALFGCLWLAWQGAWIPASLVLLADVAAQLVQSAWYGPAVGMTLLLLQGIYGRDLVRWALRLRGFADGPVVAAAGADAALLRLLAECPDVGLGLA
jgi:hypothetical protein